MTLLEVAVFNPEAFKIAQQSGAHRIEFCADYTVGGLTPKPQDLEAIANIKTVPTYVMIRPRAGNFKYTPAELNTMLEQISLCKKLNFEGVVFGVLNTQNQVDKLAISKIMEAAEGLQTTFHRAFDQTPDQETAINVLAEFKVNNILSAAWNESGIQRAKMLAQAAGKRITYMPGGGIRAANLSQLLDMGFKAFHTAALQPGGDLPNPEEITQMLKMLSHEK